MGKDWLHEIKYDGYRMHADRSRQDPAAQRTSLDWSRRYKRTIEDLRALQVKSDYLDGELCALNADGVPAFSRLQAAMNEGRADLEFFAFDLLFLDAEHSPLPLIERKVRLHRLFRKEIAGLRYSEHIVGDGPRWSGSADGCKHLSGYLGRYLQSGTRLLVSIPWQVPKNRSSLRSQRSPIRKSPPSVQG